MTYKNTFLFNTNSQEDGSRVIDARLGGLRYIQELLDHDSAKTTMIYTRIGKKSLANIKSPLDRLIEEQNTDIKTFTSIKSFEHIKEINAIVRIYTSCVSLNITIRKKSSL